MHFLLANGAKILETTTGEGREQKESRGNVRKPIARHEMLSPFLMLQENRARWRKKISGDDLAHEEAPMGTGNRSQGMFERSDAEVAGPRGQDRKYALYWDQADDPNYNASGERGRQTGRGTENDGGGRSAADVEEVAPFPYRRRRFDDIKSMQERKKEAAEADQAFNYGWVDY